MKTQTDRHFYYIQRLIKLDAKSVAPDRTGIDRLVHHDYMGSAEFEWGEVPRAWNALRTHAANKDLQRTHTTFNTLTGNPVYVITHKELDPEWLSDILGRVFSEQGVRGKEWSDFNYWMNRERQRVPYKDLQCAWITVDGGSTSRVNAVMSPEGGPVFFTVDLNLFDAVWNELHQPQT